jgi:predicted Zn-dependent protease
MKGRNSFFSSALCGIAATVLLSGCRSAQSQAHEAFSEYQSAVAVGDLIAARLALVQLVAIDDDVSTYWVDLGKVQLQLGQNDDAFNSFTRAHELDKSDVSVLGILIQLALMSGNLDFAEQKTRQLELIAPGNPVIRLTAGFVALRRGNFDEANRQAELLLVSDPYGPAAKLLKARVLHAEQKLDDAIALLSEQVRVHSTDLMSLQALIKLYQRKGDWSGVARTAHQLSRNNPANGDARLLYIEAAFRSGNADAARAASLRLLAPDAPADAVDRVLALWAEYWRGSVSIAEARRKSVAAGIHQRLAYATFFNAAGAPDSAAALVGNAPQLPITKANESANAILARSQALRGQTAEARRLYDAVLRYEPDHVYALRGRAELYFATGIPNAAIRDAQRLVSISPASAQDRLLLARAYAAAGDRRHLERTLWDAFHEIPANETVYNALRSHVLTHAGTEAADRVEEEFEQQRNVALSRDFV